MEKLSLRFIVWCLFISFLFLFTVPTLAQEEEEDEEGLEGEEGEGEKGEGEEDGGEEAGDD